MKGRTKATGLAGSLWAIGFVVAVLFSFPAALLAEGTISISATVDKTHLSLSDTLQLSVRVNGTQKAPAPALPDLPNFQVEGQGTSSSLQIINGARNASVTYQYRLTPKKTGTFEIGPVRLEMDGNTYESPPLKVTVTAEASYPDGEAPVFAEAVISNAEPYVQEQTVVTYRLYRKVEAANLGLEASADHFRKVPLGEPREYSRIINGVRYYVHELSFALFPMREGRITIPPATITLDLVHRDSRRRSPFDVFNSPHGQDPFFDSPFFGAPAQLERKNLRTQALVVQVQPLPQEGKPKYFSNLVGAFELNSQLSKNQLEAGDTTTWMVTVSGRGNVTEAVLPPLDDNPAYKIYPDQPQVKETPGNGFLEGSKTFSFALVPTGPGEITLPEIQFVYFDPDMNQYRILKTRPQTLKVFPESNTQASPSTKPAVRGNSKKTMPESELIPIHTGPELIEISETGFAGGLLWLPAFLLPPILYLIARRLRIRQLQLKQDKGFARRQSAFRRATERLQTLQERTGLDSRDLGREVSMIFRDYIGDRLNLQGTACTPAEVEQNLRDRNFEENAIRSARAILDRCEEMEYAAVRHGDSGDLLQESRQWITDLEKRP